MRKLTKHDDAASLYVRLTIDGKSCEISLKRKWYISSWCVRSGRALGKSQEVRILNEYLDAFENKIYTAKLKLFQEGEQVDVHLLKDTILGVRKNRKLILQEFDLHNTRMKELEGRDFATNTIKRYKTTYNHTKAFILWKFKAEDIELGKLNFSFISEFEFWLKSVKQCNHNSTMKYLTNFKKIVLDTVKKGWLPSDPFSRFRFTNKIVERPFLTQEEISRITSKWFKHERLAIVRDIFIFSCYSGLAYADVQKLSSSNLYVGIDNKLWLSVNRQKTGSPSRIPLLPQAAEICDRYKNHPKCITTTKLLPVLSNQKMNAYLKEIMDICDISKPLTFHVARHTFATTITLSSGVPIETVSMMLGHRSIKQTQHYAKLTDGKILRDMAHLTKLN